MVPVQIIDPLGHIAAPAQTAVARDMLVIHTVSATPSLSISPKLPGLLLPD